MKLLRSSFARAICIFGVLVLSLSLSAQSRYKNTNNGVSHYLSLQFQGGEANMFAPSEKIPFSPGLGGDGQIAFSYEVQKRRFFFNVGIHAHYTYTQTKLDQYMEAFPQHDRYGEEVSYRYHYSDLKEGQQTLTVGVPIQFGWYMGTNVYMALGVKAEYPLMHTYSTQTNIKTDGVYARFIQPFENNPFYGYYPSFPFAYAGTYDNKVCPWISPTLEIGGRIRIKKKIALRLGGYLEYGIPIGVARDKSFVDYSAINSDVQTRTQEDLASNLIINSALDCNALSRNYSRFAVGIKCAFLFHLKSKIPCVTCQDDSGIRYKPKKNNK